MPYVTISASIVGTMIIAVTKCFFIAFIVEAASNLGIKTWHPPAIRTTNAEEIPPIWQSGDVWR